MPSIVHSGSDVFVPIRAFSANQVMPPKKMPGFVEPAIFTTGATCKSCGNRDNAHDQDLVAVGIMQNTEWAKLGALDVAANCRSSDGDECWACYGWRRGSLPQGWSQDRVVQLKVVDATFKAEQEVGRAENARKRAKKEKIRHGKVDVKRFTEKSQSDKKESKETIHFYELKEFVKWKDPTGYASGSYKNEKAMEVFALTFEGVEIGEDHGDRGVYVDPRPVKFRKISRVREDAITKVVQSEAESTSDLKENWESLQEQTDGFRFAEHVGKAAQQQELSNDVKKQVVAEELAEAQDDDEDGDEDGDDDDFFNLNVATVKNKFHKGKFAKAAKSDRPKAVTQPEPKTKAASLQKKRSNTIVAALQQAADLEEEVREKWSDDQMWEQIIKTQQVERIVGRCLKCSARLSPHVLDQECVRMAARLFSEANTLQDKHAIFAKLKVANVDEHLEAGFGAEEMKVLSSVAASTLNEIIVLVCQNLVSKRKAVNDATVAKLYMRLIITEENPAQFNLGFCLCNTAKISTLELRNAQRVQQANMQESLMWLFLHGLFNTAETPMEVHAFLGSLHQVVPALPVPLKPAERVSEGWQFPACLEFHCVKTLNMNFAEASAAELFLAKQLFEHKAHLSIRLQGALRTSPLMSAGWERLKKCTENVMSPAQLAQKLSKGITVIESFLTWQPPQIKDQPLLAEAAVAAQAVALLPTSCEMLGHWDQAVEEWFKRLEPTVEAVRDAFWDAIIECMAEANQDEGFQLQSDAGDFIAVMQVLHQLRKSGREVPFLIEDDSMALDCHELLAIVGRLRVCKDAATFGLAVEDSKDTLSKLSARSPETKYSDKINVYLVGYRLALKHQVSVAVAKSRVDLTVAQLNVFTDEEKQHYHSTRVIHKIPTSVPEAKLLGVQEVKPLLDLIVEVGDMTVQS